MSKRPTMLPRQALQAEIVPGSVDRDARTVDVVWSSGARVRFWDWDIGDYDLTLGLEPENVRLDFARQGAPVLDAHGSYSVRGVLGVVDSIDVDGKQGTARLRFSERAEVESVWQDVAAGILRFVSVGTRLHALQEITEDDSKIPHYYAVDHEPLEISLAPIPRDRGAVIQSEEEGAERFPVRLINQSAESAPKEGHKMSKRNTKTAASAAGGRAPVDAEQAETGGTPPAVVTQSDDDGENDPSPAAPAAPSGSVMQADEVRRIAEQAQRDERERVVAIRRVVRQARLEDSVADELVEQGATIERAREVVLDRLASQGDDVVRRPTVSVTREEVVTIRQSVESMILHRVAPQAFALDQRAPEFVGMSLLEVCRELLAYHGISTRGASRMRVAEMALHSTSDFPEILANVANKTLRMGYEATPRSFVPWCTRATAVDFKEISRAQLGEAPKLVKVLESGEITRGTIGEGAEKYQLSTYARIVGLNRQAIVNDDLGAFTRLFQRFGDQAANLQSDLVYEILTGSPNMSDGNPLFHAASHGNQSAAAAAPSVTTLGAARAAMRSQKGLDGVTPINVQPAFLIVPVALETTAEQLVASITPDSSGNVNPFMNRLTVVPEPRLDADSASKWYAAASPNSVDTIEYAYLEGQEGPYLESRQGFDVDGIEFKARLDFAAKAIDWRGLYRNSTP